MKLGFKVLVVDDEIHIRVYIKYILRTLGQPVIVEARDGQDAIKVFQREKPDLVLLDVNLPKMDGLEALKALKAISPDCVVLMLTSLANRRTVDTALAHGARAYIRKDTSKEEIAQVLSDTIAGMEPVPI